MWGQEAQLTRIEKRLRIIPTRVGTRTVQPLPASAGGDHPHACGDKNPLYNKSVVKEGSSPRVWGQASWNKIFEEFPRIIPTRVGTRIKNCCICQRVKDHPHACGDKLSLARPRVIAVGSSPRVWGQGGILAKSLVNVRIIPTRVGTS